MTAALIVWDFDGVLNAEPAEGPFGWVADLDRTLGLSPAAFRTLLNQPEQAARVLRGQIALEDVLTAWLQGQPTDVTADTLLTHWLQAEARPDPEVRGWLQRSPQRAVIGTNNPAPRATYIMQDMGYAPLVERIFASGLVGAAKPDPGFFAEIERWSGFAPHELMLIDDSRSNTAAASARGWQTYVFNDDTRAGLPERLGIAP